MGPLIAIAMQLLPDLIGVLTGDQAGSAKDKITKAITDITGTDDPVQAQKKITEEPAVKVQLQKDLADIAFEETKEQNRAREAAEQIDLEFQRLEVADRERQRQEDYRQYLRDLQDRQEARGVQVKLAEDHSPLAWVAPIMAFALVLMIWYLLHGILTARDQVVNKDVFNVVLGALVTAFTTVVAYYFGSSLGSSKKDEALKSGALMTNPKQHAAGPDDESPSPGAP
jgi:cation transport ATPase